MHVRPFASKVRRVLSSGWLRTGRRGLLSKANSYLVSNIFRKECSSQALKNLVPLTSNAICERNQLFDKLLQKQRTNEAKRRESRKHSSKIVITLPDSTQIEGEALCTTPLSIAQSISPRLAQAAVAAKVAGTTCVKSGCN